MQVEIRPKERNSFPRSHRKVLGFISQTARAHPMPVSAAGLLLLPIGRQRFGLVEERALDVTGETEADKALSLSERCFKVLKGIPRFHRKEEMMLTLRVTARKTHSSHPPPLPRKSCLLLERGTVVPERERAPRWLEGHGLSVAVWELTPCCCRARVLAPPSSIFRDCEG